MAQAKAAYALLAGDHAAALAGIPIAHKDLFATPGWRTTASSRMLKDYVSPFDATVVTRLAEAGAVSLGNLNCDEFEMGWSNDNSAFGPVSNRRTPTGVPAGSQGVSTGAEWKSAG